MNLDQINALDEGGFIATFGAIYEHSPWVARRAWSRGPFASLDALTGALHDGVAYATREEQLALIKAHPELAGRAAIAGGLTAHSSTEQSGAGLSACSPAQFERLHQLNAQYVARFGFPFILAVRGHTPATIIEAMERRLETPMEQEFAESLRQIGRIARLRLETIVHE